MPKVDLSEVSKNTLLADKKEIPKNCVEARDRILSNFEMAKTSPLLKIFKDNPATVNGRSAPNSSAIRTYLNSKPRNNSYTDVYTNSTVDLVVQSYPSDQKPLALDSIKIHKPELFDPFERLPSRDANSWTIFINYLSPRINFYQDARRPESHQAVELIFDVGEKGCQVKDLRIHDFQTKTESRPEKYQIVELNALSCLILKVDDLEGKIPSEKRDIAETHLSFCGQITSQHDWSDLKNPTAAGVQDTSESATSPEAASK